RSFHRHRKRQRRRFIDQQNHAIQLSLARSSSQRQPNRMKQIPAPQVRTFFHGRDYFLESFRIQRATVQQQQSQPPHHFSGPITRQHSMAFHALQHSLRIIVEDQIEQFT